MHIPFPLPSSHTPSPAAYIINKKKAEVSVEQRSEGRCVVAEPAAEAKSMQGTKAFLLFRPQKAFEASWARRRPGGEFFCFCCCYCCCCFLRVFRRRTRNCVDSWLCGRTGARRSSRRCSTKHMEGRQAAKAAQAGYIPKNCVKLGKASRPRP